VTSRMLVSLVTLGDPGRLTGGYLYHLRMAELAGDQDAEVRFVPVPDRPFPLGMLAGPAVLRQAVRPGQNARNGPVDAGGAAGRPAPAQVPGAEPADVIVLDSIAAAFVGPWLWLRPRPVPVVGSLHQPPGGIDHGLARRTVQAPLDRLAWARAALLVVASQDLAERVERAGFPAPGIRVVPPGRDVAEAASAPEGDLRGGRRVALLCVANWVERKGILETLEAVARLDAGVATLHLAGDDHADHAYGAAVRARLARPDLAGRVVVHGPVPRPRVAALYQAADVFVLPSLREPYGTVWGEAMAAGLPVVGWRAGNLPHLASGQEAVMVAPGDVDGLSRALAQLAGDEPLRLRIGEAARKRAASRPTWRDSAASFFAALREAVQAAPHPSR
jgi:glycosyltransferase involved in cell wall biosynthesis